MVDKSSYLPLFGGVRGRQGDFSQSDEEAPASLMIEMGPLTDKIAKSDSRRLKALEYWKSVNNLDRFLEQVFIWLL